MGMNGVVELNSVVFCNLASIAVQIPHPHVLPNLDACCRRRRKEQMLPKTVAQTLLARTVEKR
jgi:hypothetical protein